MYRSLAILVLLAACGDNTPPPATPDARPPRPDAPATPDADLGINFTETFGAGTQDVGNWILSTNTARPREIRPTGGNPDAFLYSEVSSAIPGWSTASTRYQPGVNDTFKRDSVFVGDWYTNAFTDLSVDLDVIQAGAWTSDRTVTLHLMSWDTANDGVAFDAFYSYPDMDNAPTGWNHYDFNIAAQSPTVPAGWMFNRGDGTPGTDADWATFMHQVDLVEFGFYKPGFGYPGLGVWQLGIDNIHIGTKP